MQASLFLSCDKNDMKFYYPENHAVLCEVTLLVTLWVKVKHREKPVKEPKRASLHCFQNWTFAMRVNPLNCKVCM